MKLSKLYKHSVNEMETKIYHATIAFGFVVVDEIFDFVNSCYDLDGLYSSFEHLGMISHKECLEMLFNISPNE